MIQKIIIGVLSLLVLLAASSAVYIWYKTGKNPLNTATYMPAPGIPKAANIPKKKVQAPHMIIVIDKPIVFEKLKLPEWIKDSPDEQIIATAAIPPYKGTTNAIALMNTKEGTTQIIAKQEPMSLFGFVNEKTIGTRLGVDTKGAMVTVIYGQWDFVRVGNINIGAYGDINFGNNVGPNGDAKIQINIGYKF